MKYVLTSKEMQDSDQYTISLGTPAIDLMEKAGLGIFNDVKKLIKPSDKILIVSGSGGNGGDGYVIARYLYEDGYDVTVLGLGSHFNHECEVNRNLYKGKLVDCIEDFSQFNCIIDAIFGVGLSRNIEGKYFDIITKLNEINCLKISVDIPSGIDATTGKVLGTAFKADYVYTIQNYKRGLFLDESVNYYDHLKVINIGIVSKKYDDFIKVLDEEDLVPLFPKRKRLSNKGSYGKVALIGGSKLLMGAVLLSANALASLRMGVGYSTICVPESLHSLYALKNLENIYWVLKDKDGQIQFDEEGLKKLLTYDVLTIGMGIGTSEEVYKTICYLLKNYTHNLIIDADGLNSLARYGIEVLKEHKCNVILTPHLKEFSRLDGKEIDEFKDDIVNEVKSFAKTYNVVINCKSTTSIITDGNEVYFNITGNPGLAKGGSGDVLSGITAGILANNQENLLLSTVSGAFVLGKAAQFATINISESCLIASDVVDQINKVIIEIQNIK